ncbi:MAG TPA: hypothetical protein VKZ84_04740 [Bacteriovoracaceae bacterium]|nr:hypothetical protein [Bacteriovoracaceae bacterium]
MNRFYLFVFILCFNSFASSCLLTDALKDPALSNNEKFWEDYSALVSKGMNSDAALKQLHSKFQTAPKVSSSTGVAVGNPHARRLKYNKRAENELRTLPKNLKKKVDEFLEIAMAPRGFAKIRNNPGRWHWEKIPQFGPDAQSVRLNGGYRVLFDLKDNELVIREINKGHIHGS